MNFFHCNLFQEIFIYLRHYRFFLDWDEFPLVTAVAGIGKGKRFNISSQFLRYPDLLFEVQTFLQSVSAFLQIFGSWPNKNNHLLACQHMVIFQVESELRCPWKRLFSFAYLPLLLLLRLVTFCCFCENFAPLYPLSLPTMLFAWWGVFPKVLLSTCTVFKTSTCQQFFWLFVSLYCFMTSAHESLCQKTFIFFPE